MPPIPDNPPRLRVLIVRGGVEELPWVSTLGAHGFAIELTRAADLPSTNADVAVVSETVPPGEWNEVLKALRRGGRSPIPVLFRVAASPPDIAALLDSGAADVISPTACDQELIARIGVYGRLARYEEGTAGAGQVEAELADEVAGADGVRLSRHFLTEVIEALAHPFFVIDVSDCRILLANTAGGGREAVGRACHLVSHASPHRCSSAAHPCPIEQVRATRRPVVVEHVHVDESGAQREFEIHGYPLLDAQGRVKQMIEYALDITSRRLAERETRRRNRELTLLNEVIAAAASDAGAGAVMAAACHGLRAAFELYRVTALLFEGAEAMRVVAEDAADGAALGLSGRLMPGDVGWPSRAIGCEDVIAVRNVRQEPRLAAHQDALRARRTASIVLVPVSVQEECVGVLYLEHDQPRAYHDSELELTRRVADQVGVALAHARMADARRLLGVGVEQTADSVVITDADGVIAYVNPAFERVTGYTRAEAVGKKPSVLKSGRHDAAYYAQLWGTILDGRVWRGRLTNRAKSGALFTEDAVITPIRDARGKTVNFIALKRDVTRELELEDHVRQAQKLESIGRLAGEVAHDFNNMLAVILGYAAMAIARIPADSPAYESVKEIEDTAQRAATVTRQLLTFSRRQVTEPRPVDLRVVLSRLDRMLARIAGGMVDMTISAPRDLSLVRADASQMEQVIVNLVLNARDAMPSGGRLGIDLANVTIAHDMPFPEGAAPGEYVSLSVSDTGIGMSDEVKAHLFEPFFTTKGRERGTGLGLATCFGIVKQSRGHIWAESRPGEGTCVRVLLPRVAPAGRPHQAAVPSAGIPRGTETVFVAEDEDLIRKTTSATLRKLGYTVLEAEDGEVALQLASSRLGEIDLLLTDVAMPRMSGADLARALLSRRPDLPVVFTTGFARDMPMDAPASAKVACLPKPYTAATLAQTIRDLLDAGKA